MLSACICSSKPLPAVQVVHLLETLSQAGVGAVWWSSPTRAGGSPVSLLACRTYWWWRSSSEAPFSPQNTPGPCLLSTGQQCEESLPCQGRTSSQGIRSRAAWCPVRNKTIFFFYQLPFRCICSVPSGLEQWDTTSAVPVQHSKTLLWYSLASLKTRMCGSAKLSGVHCSDWVGWSPVFRLLG